MAGNLPKHMYETLNDNGDITAPPYAAQFENVYNGHTFHL
jgi:hypothetical protein